LECRGIVRADPIQPDKKEDTLYKKKLFFGFERLILRKYGRNGFCGYGPPHELGQFTAVVDMGDLETDDEPEAETGDAD
jgi:hypothetical protein